ncbi:MAG: haloacid dehalogenase-like hydrolase [Proteobacteria bacterium]|nr:haloacid dehalogenase-like hydrolase [Pseudomonadota bacterium]
MIGSKKNLSKKKISRKNLCSINSALCSKIVLFDFDGTLSAGDTTIDFWKYSFLHSVRPWVFSPVIPIALTLKYANRFVKKIFHIKRLTRFDTLWREMLHCYETPELMRRLSPGFIAEHRRKRFAWAADQVARERAAGSVVVMISAGLNEFLTPLIEDMGFDYILCTRMIESHPWKFRFFCYRENKVDALNGLLRAEFGCDLNSEKTPFRVVRAYSDDSSDRPMMGLAKQAVWIDPETGNVREVTGKR